jgi:diguanylate cyclase
MPDEDDLTRLSQRAEIILKIDEAVRQAENDGQQITLVFLDLDHFLQFNDTYGHQAGDDWIRAIVALFHEAFGQNDLVGRYGGDEFIAAVIGENPSGLFDRAELLRQRVEKDGPSIRVNGEVIQPGYTISMGLAEYPGDAGYVNDLIEKARQAMYRAKEAGGNAVRFYEEKDILTGLFNRFGIVRKLDEVCAQARQQREEVSVLMVDIDQFKELNDRYGSRAGDEVLKCVARILRQNFEGEGIVGRYMGDSFLVIMPGKRSDSTFILAEEVRKLMKESGTEIHSGNQRIPLSIGLSGGVASFPSDASERVDLLRKVDEALYRAKNSGRNRICLPTSTQMVTKTSHFSQTQLERLTAMAKKLEKSEAFLLREALDDLLRKYRDDERS